MWTGMKSGHVKKLLQIEDEEGNRWDLAYLCGLLVSLESNLSVPECVSHLWGKNGCFENG